MKKPTMKPKPKPKPKKKPMQTAARSGNSGKKPTSKPGRA